MIKSCDHTSVGMIIKKQDSILLIERMKPPFGFAPPAGHLDGDTYENSAIRETQEEVGLKVNKVTLIAEGRKENPCRRTDGSWHYWKIYELETEGEIKRSLDETKQASWCSREQISTLAKKTEEYLQGNISQEEWEKETEMQINNEEAKSNKKFL